MNIGNLLSINLSSGSSLSARTTNTQGAKRNFSSVMESHLTESHPKINLNTQSLNKADELPPSMKDLPSDIQDLLISLLALFDNQILDSHTDDFIIRRDFLLETFEEVIGQLSQLINKNAETQQQIRQELKVNINELETFYLTASSGKSLLSKQEAIGQFKETVRQLTQGIAFSENDPDKYDISYDGKAILRDIFTRSTNQSLNATKTTEVDEIKTGQQTIFLGPQMTKEQQFFLHLGQKVNQTNPEQFIRQFENILAKSTLTQSPNGLNELSIKLFPEHLGRLDVKLLQQDGKLFAQLRTTTAAAKESIESQIHLLKQAFAAQNIQIEKIEITQQHHQQFTDSQKEGHNDQQREPEQQASKKEENELEFNDMLEESFNTKV
ncbi:MAG: flagellar hook-length control protein FliK [Bacillaceae bacterium]|nr:flagellar hook-length control protein FliK [Bacillaceae bacterium]